jgi:LmbE family N-acetylglucosaminyl deacetylase
MRRRTLSLCLAVLLVPAVTIADPRPREPLDAAAVHLALKKLGVAGSALYVGAHPDDENTAMIAWLSKGRMVRTAYLSMTRGDGGQNLIGPDVGERLGVIRTQELLAARRIDGGEQLFTRAIDFGYSKNPGETLETWGHERILADVVWAIRRFRPDVIIERFPTDGSGGHGHHTASALLAEEAFAAAADSTRFPDQLRFVRPWRATRLVWNVFRFGDAGPDTARGRLHVDLGEYSALLGRSFTELAGESRSMHKTQGFGAAERRGTWVNALEHRLGDRASRDLFDGVDLGWTRFRGGAPIAPLLQRAQREFDAEHPERLVPVLLEVRAAMASLPDEPIVLRRLQELDQLIRACSGLWIEAVASQHTVSPGGRLSVVTSALVRTATSVEVRGIEVRANLGSVPRAAPTLAERAPGRTLARNEPRNDTLALTLPADIASEGPYWLDGRPSAGAFDVSDQRLIGTPENAPRLVARFRLAVSGQPFEFDTPVVFRWTDPVHGERYRDVAVVPAAALRLDCASYLFPDAAPRDVRVNVMATDRSLEGSLSLRLPDGWRSEPAALRIALSGREADTTVTFRVTPGATPGASTVTAELRTSDGATCNTQLVRLDYPHIPIQTLLPRAEAHLVRADVSHRGTTLGYVMGSGDQVNEALAQIGYRVELLSDDDVERGDLSRFDVIVIGVRAYNTRPRLRRLQRRLLDYVAGGGRLVIQYQTPETALEDRLGPYPFKISRDRVTVEQAEMRPLAGAGELLTAPNRIDSADFDGWVQERGLSFANPWDAKYRTVLSANDPGEPPKDGGVLFARHGRGAFVYTGLAFFRQLPAGVPGAYRLFANLVSPEGPR